MKRIFYFCLLLTFFCSCAHTSSSATPSGGKEETGKPVPEEGTPGPQDDPEDQAVFTIGLVADPQYADVDDRGPRHYRSPLRKLPEAIAVFNREQVDRVICLGDILDRNPADLDALLLLFAESDAPVHHILGNHDFSHLHDVPAHLKKLGMPSLYYTVHVPGWCFIFLDTNDLANYAPMTTEKRAEYEALHAKVVAAGTPNAENWNGGVGKEQLAWLKRQLDAAAAAGENVLVFGHHPLVPMTNHTALNAEQILDLLVSYREVKAYINGHYHPGAYEEYKGLPCLTLEAMLEGGEQNSYAILTLETNHIGFQPYGRVAPRIIPFR